MEIPTRWIKVLKDIWGNKTRSLLVVLSIAVGIAAVGMINAAREIVETDLYKDFWAGNPASLIIYVSPFQKNMPAAVQSMREVEQAEARRQSSALILGPTGNWEDLTLNVLENFNERKVSRYSVEAGKESPGGREIVLERRSAEALKVTVGDEVTVRMPDKREFKLKVSGIVHDVYVLPFPLLNEATGYLRMETLEWMGERPYYNQIYLTASENKLDREHVLKVGSLARDRVIERDGFSVYRIQIPGIGSEPGQHWAHSQMMGFLLILQIMGVMAIVLSAGLVINTVSAIMTQQVRQLGILRSMGGVRQQLIGMYLINILILSVLALIIALPLGLLGALGISSLAAHFINFDLDAVFLPRAVLLWQIGLGIFMPILAAMYPILNGARISVYDAIYQYGMGSEENEGPVDRFLLRLRRLSPPVLLSLRNTFRKKVRLSFTLVTLTLAGAMFISVFSTRTSLTAQIQQISHYVSFDASLSTSPGTRLSTALREAERIPGIEIAEGWASAGGVIIHPDGSESKALQITGLPADSQTIDPMMLDGRWLRETDQQVVVVNSDLLEAEPYLHIGSEIKLKAGERERTYTIVGVTSKHLSGGRVYMKYTEFGSFLERQNQVDEVRVRASSASISDSQTQKIIAGRLENRFDNAGLSESNSVTQFDIFADFTQVFDIILIVLMIMAGVLSVVGGLGLAGVMGLNVLERTREIGVLRAIGASNVSVGQVVVIEGVSVGLLSWILGALVSVPSGFLLAGAVIQAVLKANLIYRYSFWGLAIWLVVIVVIGFLSSLAPARSASRLTIREVLEYE